MGDAAAVKLRQPVGLYVLFLVEMWERFGFYSMAAIFVLYMKDEGNGYPYLQEKASLIYGQYLAGVYFAPFFGGLLADWKLGPRWSIAIGAVGLSAGYGLLGINRIDCFWAGLMCLVSGNGLFKPNISALVSRLYPAGDSRVDSGFTIFYMGINVGAFFAPLVAGMIRKEYGFHAAFLAAAIGMALSLALFLTLQRFIVEHEQPAGEETMADDVPAALQWKRNLALALFFGINILFWMAFKQNGNSLSVWAKDRTDRVAPEYIVKPLAALHVDKIVLNGTGHVMPEYFASINPFFVVAFSPLLVSVWSRMRSFNFEPPTPAKLTLGFALTTAAFTIMARVAYQIPGLASSWYLVMTYAVLTLGELCLSPMGLSLVGRLAAPHTRSIWMGGFFASIAVGGYMSGYIRNVTKEWSYGAFFALLAGTSLFAMCLMLAAYPVISAALPATKRTSDPLPEDVA